MTIYRTRIRRGRVAALLVVVTAIAAALAHLPASSSAPAEAPVGVSRGEHSEPDSAIPDGTTVFDDQVAGVARLDPDLLAALRRAATDAAAGGVEFYVDSGRRSPEYQERLFREAVAKYGSAAEAARWVATPERSAHVSGDAIDIGHSDARTWLSEHGAGYGLCQTYANEPWHYELRPEAIGGACPPVYADASDSPAPTRER